MNSLLALLADLLTIVLNDVSIGESESFELIRDLDTRTTEGIRFSRRQSDEEIPNGLLQVV